MVAIDVLIKLETIDLIKLLTVFSIYNIFRSYVLYLRRFTIVGDIAFDRGFIHLLNPHRNFVNVAAVAPCVFIIIVQRDYRTLALFVIYMWLEIPLKFHIFNGMVKLLHLNVESMVLLIEK